MDSIHLARELCATRPPADATYAEQTRRRALRWHAWLKSPECTLQDRENFERWCNDAANAAAYVALCGGLACGPELASEFDDDSLVPAALTPRAPRLDADAR
jgi:ferric-dicitrate binding protein FerR (iron transport regulator)